MSNSKLFCILFLFQTFIVFGQKDSIQTDRTKLTFGKWGLGFDFGPCTGPYFVYGDAKEKIKCECIVNLGLTFSYNRVHYMFRIMPTEGELKNNLDYGQEWKKGNRFQSMNFELAVGYETLNKRIFNIIPISSVGLSSFRTSPLDDNEQKIKTDYHFSWSLGTAFDFKLNIPAIKKNREDRIKYSEEELKYNVAYVYLRVLTGIYPTYFQHPFDMNGGLYYFNISIGAYLRAAKILK